jgi:hypothetical protein
VCQRCRSEPGHRVHSDSTSPLRRAGVSLSALCSLLHPDGGDIEAEPLATRPVLLSMGQGPDYIINN